MDGLLGGGRSRSLERPVRFGWTFHFHEVSCYAVPISSTCTSAHLFVLSNPVPASPSCLPCSLERNWNCLNDEVLSKFLDFLLSGMLYPFSVSSPRLRITILPLNSPAAANPGDTKTTGNTIPPGSFLRECAKVLGSVGLFDLWIHHGCRTSCHQQEYDH